MKRILHRISGCFFMGILLALAMAGCKKEDYTGPDKPGVTPKVDYSAFSFDYYVDKSHSEASDGNSGSEELPWTRLRESGTRGHTRTEIKTRE